VPASKGHLNPGDPDVAFDRFEPGPGLADLVRHVWVVRWRVPAGVSRPQRVLSYPAFNAVFQPGDDIALYGPDSRLSVRTLEGTGWAVGILFRPAAAPLLTGTAATELVGRAEPMAGAPAPQVEAVMHDAVVDRPARTRDAGLDRAALVRVLRGWLGPIAAQVDDLGRLVNRACRIAEEDAGLIRAVDLAQRLGLSPRSLERLVRRHVGMTPKWLIECRRLQHAATTLFADPEVQLSRLAAELGYADYSHFSRQYERVLGESPHRTRELSRAERSHIERSHAGSTGESES